MTSGGASAAIVGLGGMGLRYVASCRSLGIEVAAMYDGRQAAVERALADVPSAQACRDEDEFVQAATRVDLVCVVTNTPSRAPLLKRLAAAGVTRVLTEKPFTTSVADAHALTSLYRAAGIPLTVNTFRHFCPNHLRLRDLLRGGELGAPRHVSIQCASTGLGNMGSVFFDMMNFYLDSAPIEVTGVLDRAGTP